MHESVCLKQLPVDAPPMIAATSPNVGCLKEALQWPTLLEVKESESDSRFHLKPLPVSEYSDIFVALVFPPVATRYPSSVAVTEK